MQQFIMLSFVKPRHVVMIDVLWQIFQIQSYGVDKVPLFLAVTQIFFKSSLQ